MRHTHLAMIDLAYFLSGWSINALSSLLQLGDCLKIYISFIPLLTNIRPFNIEWPTIFQLLNLFACKRARAGSSCLFRNRSRGRAIRRVYWFHFWKSLPKTAVERASQRKCCQVRIRKAAAILLPSLVAFCRLTVVTRGMFLVGEGGTNSSFPALAPRVETYPHLLQALWTDFIPTDLRFKQFIFFHYTLLQDIEYSSPCYTVLDLVVFLLYIAVCIC